RGPRHHHIHESSKGGGPEPVHYNYNKEDEVDVCKGWYCGHGRECRRGSDGAPECICIRECHDKSKEICGTDGRRYTSHCELHRTACLL
ncbi:Follistatin-related protein 1, partial [Orchesella cincta]